MSKPRYKADSLTEGFKQFTGGYWAEIETPDCLFTVRPDGSWYVRESSKICREFKMRITDTETAP